LSQIDKLIFPGKRLIYGELEDEILEPYDKIYLNMVSIDKNAFVDLPNLKSLHLRSVNISDIDLEHMINLRELRLEIYTAIDTLILPANLEKFSIIELPIRLDSLMILTNLISLELDSIEDLVITNSKPFSSLKSLKQLSIKYSSLLFKVSVYTMNKIEFGSEKIEDLTLYENTYTFDHGYGARTKTDMSMIYFENLPYLKKLNVSISLVNPGKNGLIDIVSFRALANLECLEFRFRSQEGMKGLLNNFTKLKKLKLTFISSIDDSSFSNLVNLEYLELCNCYLGNHLKSSISFNAFANLNKLSHLDLGDSFRLESLDASFFKYIHNLESFAVSGLKKIQDGAFIKLNKLKKLVLKQCYLVEITENTFQDINSLEELNLSYNKLKNIEARSFDHVKTLKYLDLSKLKYMFLLKTKSGQRK
jgi:hypothetical protein